MNYFNNEVCDGTSIHAMRPIDYSSHRKYIHNIMEARKCADSYKLLCTPIYSKEYGFGASYIPTEDNGGLISAEFIYDAYHKAKEEGKAYFVLMVSREYSTFDDKLPEQTSDVIKTLASEKSLQMVLTTDGPYWAYDAIDHYFPGDQFFIFSLKEEMDSVHFVDTFYEVQSELQDICSDYFFGKGTSYKLKYSDFIDNRLNLNEEYHRIQRKELEKKSEDTITVILNDFISVSSSHCDSFVVDDSKQFASVLDFSEKTGEVLSFKPFDSKGLKESEVIEGHTICAYQIPANSIALKRSQSYSFNPRYLYLLNSTDQPLLVVGEMNSDCRVITFNSKVVSGNFLVLKAMEDNGGLLSTLIHSFMGGGTSISLSDILNMKVCIPNIISQSIAVDAFKKEYSHVLEIEGVRRNILNTSADIAHMLGTTFSRQAGIMLKLKKKIAKGQPVENDQVKKLMDTVDYVSRFIKNYCGNFENVVFKLREVEILSFINEYCEEWKNSLGERFDIVIKNEITDDNIVSIDTRYLKVAFDSLFDNAYRHGFGKVSSLKNKVVINLSLVRYRNKTFIRIGVLNNGKPFADDFSLEVFKSRGRYMASSGHTGLGGNHIYQIVQGHNGFLALNNDLGLTGFDILLPLYKKISNIRHIYNYDKETI